MKKNTKFITCIYDNLYGTELGGRISRGAHYKFSLLSLLKMTDADFVCYTSAEEIDDLRNFFYNENNIDKELLTLKVYDIKKSFFLKIIDEYKNIEETKKSDRCIEIQYMKFIWFFMEDMTYDYYFWVDAGLSHCGLIPSRYLSLNGTHTRGYYESTIFNNNFLKNLVLETKDKFSIIAKENQRNYWSGTVNPIHYNNYNSSKHVIGGLFGGKKEIFSKMVQIFIEYVYKITKKDGRLYHEENIMSVMFRNFEEDFHVFDFDTWWHEEERIHNFDMIEHTTLNKSFYKILEELNGLKK